MPSHIIGIDIGGTKIAAGTYLLRSRRVLDHGTSPHRTRTAKTSLQSVVEAIDQYYTKGVTQAIGVGIAGMVNPETGVFFEGPHLPTGLKNFSIKKYLEQHFRVPVSVDNDANCIGLAEALVGAGQNARTVLTLTLGTGIGAGLVMDGNIFHGGKYATEFGHIIVDGKTPLEDLASGPALERTFRRIAKKKANSYTIVTLAKQRNRAAQRAVAEVARWFGIGIQNAIYAYSPDVVVLGGGLGRERSITKPAIARATQGLRFAALRQTHIVPSKLKYHAGIIGAALLTTR